MLHLLCQPRHWILPTPTMVTMPGVSSKSGGWPKTVILRQLRENGQLEIRLGVSQAALHAAEEEASAIQAWLSKSDAMVVGKMNSRNALFQFPLSFMLITFLFL